MTRTFIETLSFTAKQKDLGLADKNLKDLQEVRLEKADLHPRSENWNIKGITKRHNKHSKIHDVHRVKSYHLK